MASSRPDDSSTTQKSNQTSDAIWKKRLEGAMDKLKNDLQICSDTIVKLCTEKNIIKSGDIDAFERFRPAVRITEIIYRVSRGDRQTYEHFREILRQAGHGGLYKQLEIKEDDEPEQCIDATSRPTSTSHNKDSDDIWKEWLKDKEEALVNGLRLYPSVILNKLIAANMIKDVDVLETKKLDSAEKKVRKIIFLVLLGKRETYDKFRNILKECKFTALNDLLEIKKAEPKQVSGKGDYDELIQEIRKNAKKSNDDRKTILEAVEKVERIQAEEIKRLRSLEEQRQQECNCVEKTIKELKSQIAKMKEALKQNKGSRHEIEQLQTELNEKQKAYEALKQAVADLRKKIHAMRLDVGSDNIESVR